ncbi:MAG: formylglycine-generating enzyme family protein [Bacteroidales bacterium]|jgi:formylglycine-generating enzyme required for sulfatase activity|nr:formylglycine-generating enzyme family protein [Bacteroidales bacterium]
MTPIFSVAFRLVVRKRLTIFSLFVSIAFLSCNNGNSYFTENVNGVSFDMVLVEKGSFLMGTQATDINGENYDPNAETDESPVHETVITKDYYIGKMEVTQALWSAVMNRDGDYSPPWSATFGLEDNYPAYYVSWDDIQLFIKRLNAITGKKYRLPTEAEWEFAARGGSQSQGYKYSGSDSIADVAWYFENSGNSSHEVGTKSPNELGIYDMSGNAWEWCQDYYGAYSAENQTHLHGVSTASYRVVRGGGWRYNARYCRVSNRFKIIPDFRLFNLGFRLACEN